MKNKYIFMVVSFFLCIGLYFFFMVSKNEVSNDIAIYKNVKLGIEFGYRTGIDGYVVQEMIPSNNIEDLISTIVVIPHKDSIREIPIGGEGPATITIQILKNLKKQEPLLWANENYIYSNINLKIGDVDEYVVDKVNAIRYNATGLYDSDNLIVSYGDNIYVMTGNYLDIESDLRKDFMPLVESFKFI